MFMCLDTHRQRRSQQLRKNIEVASSVEPLLRQKYVVVAA